MTYIAATLNPEILKNFPGPVRVGKKKSGSGRVAGTRQGLIINPFILAAEIDKPARLIIRLLFGFDKPNQFTNSETVLLSTLR